MAKKKNAKKNAPPLLDDFLDMIKEIKDEPDRGKALVLTSWLGDALERYMEARVVDDPKLIDGLFGQDRPLGTFSARINAAYAFAFISKGIYQDLHAIRDIRNRFAHERCRISFEDQSIADKCKNLELIKKHEATRPAPPARVTEPRGQFLLATLMYTGYFICCTGMSQRLQVSDAEEQRIFANNVIPRIMKLLPQIMQKSGMDIHCGLGSPS